MRQCRHARKGIVVNRSYAETKDVSKHKAATSVCDRPDCIAAAIKRIAGEANEEAIYVMDATAS